MGRSSRSTTTGIATAVSGRKTFRIGLVEAVGPLQQGLRPIWYMRDFMSQIVEAVGPLQQGLRLLSAGLDPKILGSRSSRSTTTGIATLITCD